jgi:hypothetical protein
MPGLESAWRRVVRQCFLTCGEFQIVAADVDLAKAAPRPRRRQVHGRRPCVGNVVVPLSVRADRRDHIERHFVREVRAFDADDDGVAVDDQLRTAGSDLPLVIRACIDGKLDADIVRRRLAEQADAEPQHVVRLVVSVGELSCIGERRVATVAFGIDSDDAPDICS